MFTKAYAAVKLDTLVKLKESSKKLIYVLENIHSKSRSKDDYCTDDSSLSAALTCIETDYSASDRAASKELECQLNNILSIQLQDDEDDDCSVYKKLTRKCQCLNMPEFNDFVIHFNEDTKYYKSNFGEVVKNVRILKKFMYMGANYTDHALIFLHKGLCDSTYSERIEIIQACANADICNIFEECSIVEQCIAPPLRKPFINSASINFTENMASRLLYKMATIEDGRRYLNLSSKLTHELSRVLKKISSKMSVDTMEFINQTVDLLNNQFPLHLHAYRWKSLEIECGIKALESLSNYRQFMTFDEVLSQLDLIKNRSIFDSFKTEIAKIFPSLLVLFKNMIVEYDNSEINIIVTTILNNLVIKQTNYDDNVPKTYVVADASTEPVMKKDGSGQIPPKRNIVKKQKSSKMNHSKVIVCSARSASRLGFK